MMILAWAYLCSTLNIFYHNKVSNFISNIFFCSNNLSAIILRLQFSWAVLLKR